MRKDSDIDILITLLLSHDSAKAWSFSFLLNPIDMPNKRTHKAMNFATERLEYLCRLLKEFENLEHIFDNASDSLKFLPRAQEALERGKESIIKSLYP